MCLNRQSNKIFMRFLVVFLPIFVLHLNFGYSADTKSGYADSGKDAYNSFTNIYKPFYYLNYYSSIAGLPEEETVAIHFLRAVTRYFQYPQRFLNNDQYSIALPFFNFSLSFYLFLNLFKKQVNNTPEIAIHIGGHAPPALLNF